MIKNTFDQAHSSDGQAKFLLDRVSQVEKHLSDLCSHMGTYCRKSASVRDSGDSVAFSLLSYAETENLNQTLKVSLVHLSDIFATIQDYREAEIHRLERNVIQELSYYSNICKQTKEDLKKSFSVREKELAKKHKLEKIRGRHSTNWHQLSQAESELHKATSEAARSTKVLEKQIDEFEKKKLSDLKRLMLEFLNIELVFHARSIELLTDAYQSVSGIDEEQDLESFRTCIKAPIATSSLDVVRSALSSPVYSRTTNFGGSMPALNNNGSTIIHSKTSDKKVSSSLGQLHETTRTSYINDSSDLGSDDEEEEEEEEDEKKARGSFFKR